MRHLSFTIFPPTPTATPSATPTQPVNTFTGAAYTYDGDGNMVKSVIDGVTTYYVGGYYELQVEGETETEVKYYYAASLRIAMRTDGILNWLFSDHLSSTTIITDESGTIISEMKYTAFGEVRSENGVSPTDYLYTGQRYEVEFGLSYYVARWYDSSTAHFISADTIIPQPGNALDWDRYAYVLWNPMRYTDPSGHALVGPNDPDPMIDFEWEKQRNPPQNRLTPSFYRWNIKNEFGIIISDAIPPTWDSWYQAVYWAAWNQGFFYNTKAGTSLSPQEAFLEYQYDGITIRYQNEGLTETSYCYESSPSSARGACVSGADGAAYINIFNIELGEEDRDYLERLIHMEHELTHTVSWSLFYERGNGPYYDENAWYSALTDPYAGLADHSIWLQNSSITPNEVIANLTPAVAHGAWKNNYFGRQNAVMMGYYWTSWLSGGDKYDWIK